MKQFIFVFLIILSASAFSQASRCHSDQKAIFIDPCNIGGSGNNQGGSSPGDDWSGGRDYEIFPVEGERIDPVGADRRGGGPNLGNLGSISYRPGDRGEPGSAYEPSPEEDTQDPQEEKGCEKIAGIYHNGEILGISLSGCASPSQYPDPEAYAIENFQDTASRMVETLTLDTINDMSPPDFRELRELKFEINLSLEGVSEQAMSDFINQAMAQIQINLREAIVDTSKINLGRMRDYLISEINLEVNEVGGGPSLYVTVNDSTRSDQEGPTSLASPRGEFREALKSLDQRLKRIHPKDSKKNQAKDLAHSTLKVADEEFYKGNNEVAETSLNIATELADFAASLTPGLSIAKDAFELFTGKNAITGDSLTDSDRVFAGLGLMTLGGANWFNFAPKLIKRTLKTLKDKKLYSQLNRTKEEIFNLLDIDSVYEGFKEIINSSKRIKLKSESQIKKFISFKSSSKSDIWTSGRELSEIENAYEHWIKHKNSFPEINNAKDYVEKARKFLNNPPMGTQHRIRPNGDKILYNAAENIFGVITINGTPKTMFRPKSGIAYWDRLLKKEGL